VNSKTLTDEQFTAAGGNSSLIHVDWMIGSASVDVDGLDAAGMPRRHAQGRMGAVSGRSVGLRRDRRKA
jgi:hypothetical protein